MDLKKLKIPELKKELTSRGLALKGNKQELVNRLSQYLEENGEVISADESPRTGEEPVTKGRDESLLDNGTEPADALLTQGVEEEADLLAQEDEPSLLDDEEDEPEPVVTVPKVTSPVVLQRQPVVAMPQAKPSVPAGEGQKIAVTPASVATLTPEQKKALRAERFNTPLSEEAKKQARLKKFGGTPATSVEVPTSQSKVSTLSSEAMDKLKKRSERFGTAVSPVMKKTEEMDRLMKRKQRFGVITNTTTTMAAATGIRKLSTEGTGDDTEAKKRKRAERFGLSS